ncbi:biopolymer transporter ExbD [Pedobacter sp. AW1-32]|uniref:biopolymer transporter ExbD n=1 Tax=Pedobacter sp. AW1-32 TaxID=3383026 RepID=UPI003FF122E9
MATLNESSNSKAVKGRSKKPVPRVDLTAMVDLMFLLTTFFMLTTTLSQLNAADVVKPDKSDDTVTADYPASRTMTILLAKNSNVVYYMGTSKNAKMAVTTVANIQQEILVNMQAVHSANAKAKHLLVILKPTKTARFKDFVDLIDEMKIADVKSYAIDDDHQTLEEIHFLKQKAL